MQDWEPARLAFAHKQTFAYPSFNITLEPIDCQQTALLRDSFHRVANSLP